MIAIASCDNIRFMMSTVVGHYSRLPVGPVLAGLALAPFPEVDCRINPGPGLSSHPRVLDAEVLPAVPERMDPDYAT